MALRKEKIDVFEAGPACEHATLAERPDKGEWRRGHASLMIYL